MSDDKRRLCKWDKDEIKENLDQVRAIVTDARFVCRKCGRVANDKAWLCKPELIQEKD